MSTYDLPGNRTDRLAKGSISQYTVVDGCMISDTPTLRESNWGHRLVLEEDPGDDVPAWFGRWFNVHGHKGVHTALLTWEDLTEGPLEGVHGGNNLRLGTLGEWSVPDGVEIRDIEGDEWSAATELEIELNHRDDPTGRAYSERSLEERRLRVEAGEARQYGAFVDGQLVGLTALIEDENEARYQDVQVLEAFRRKGIATALVASLAADARTRRPNMPLFINAKISSPAEGIYRGLGFEFVSRQRWWILPGPLREAEIERRWGLLQAGTIAADDWKHRDHLWGAVCALRDFGDGALDEFRGILQRLLVALGVETTETTGYHETVTRGWLEIVAAQRRQFPKDSLEEAVIRAQLAFADKKHLLKHWSRDLIMSTEARSGWVKPDLEPLPT